MSGNRNSVIALTGGVGGAKLALGFSDIVPPEQLHIVVNTGDDFEHMGLTICPDLDTILYTLSGRNNEQQGWGLEDESWRMMDALGKLGGETWFQLGDLDLATHLFRTHILASGGGLHSIAEQLAEKMGVRAKIYPMTEDRVRTIVNTQGEGDLPFQRYFVERQCDPAVSGFRFSGIDEASLNPRFAEILSTNAACDIIICPSNPFVSVDPILQLPGCWQALRESKAVVTAVSPIVSNMAIKGPAAKMMAELDMPVTALGVAQYYVERYPGLLDRFVIDISDGGLRDAVAALGLDVLVTDTIMKTRQDKKALAEQLLA